MWAEKPRLRNRFTNVDGGCYRQGNQGLVLHDDVFTRCHGDKVPNPICFGDGMDHFLSETGNQLIKQVQTMCVCVCVFILYNNNLNSAL